MRVWGGNPKLGNAIAPGSHPERAAGSRAPLTQGFGATRRVTGADCPQRRAFCPLQLLPLRPLLCLSHAEHRVTQRSHYSVAPSGLTGLRRANNPALARAATPSPVRQEPHGLRLRQQFSQRDPRSKSSAQSSHCCRPAASAAAAAAAAMACGTGCQGHSLNPAQQAVQVGGAGLARRRQPAARHALEAPCRQHGVSGIMQRVSTAC